MDTALDVGMRFCVECKCLILHDSDLLRVCDNNWVRRITAAKRVDIPVIQDAVQVMI